MFTCCYCLINQTWIETSDWLTIKSTVLIQNKHHVTTKIFTWIAFLSVSPRSRNLPSVSRMRSFTIPIMHAFSTDECASFEQYAMSFDRRRPSSTNGKRTRSSFITSKRAARSDTKLHSEAELWMTPPPRPPSVRGRNSAGRPIILPNQSSIMTSSSVIAGHDAWKEVVSNQKPMPSFRFLFSETVVSEPNISRFPLLQPIARLNFYHLPSWSRRSRENLLTCQRGSTGTSFLQGSTRGIWNH